MDTTSTATFEPDLLGHHLPDRVTQDLERRFAGRDPLRVLDAGCGAHSHVRLALPSHVVGIDASEHQIARNTDVDEGIVSTLEEAPIEREAFDLVVCWEVVEHLRDPFAVIDKLIDALLPGGVLVLAWPNLNSAKAVVARALPYSVHVRWFRWLYPNVAVENDGGPFETVLAKGLTAKRVVAHGRSRGLHLLELISYESQAQRKMRRKLRVTGRRWDAAKSAVHGVTGGRLEAEPTDLIAVFAKP